MMIKEGTGNGTLVKNEQESGSKPPLPDPVLLQPHKYYSGTCMKWHHIQVTLYYAVGCQSPEFVSPKTL